MLGKIFKFGLIQVFSSKSVKITGSIILIVAMLGGIFYYGYQSGYQKGVENPKTLIIRGVANLENGKEEGIDFNVFWEAWKVIQDKYVKAGEIENQDLVYCAVSGLIDSLKDPNSVFMPPSDAKKFGEDISGEFSGIGAEIGIKNDQLIIIAPLKGTPADLAGLKPGDKILKIYNKLTQGLSVDEAIKIIRGKKGTEVILTISRDSWNETKEKI